VAPLSGETAPMKAEARVPHPADLLALQVPSKWILEAAAATSRDQAQETAGSVAQCELQAGDEELPERRSPVEVQQTLHQEEAARETGDEELPERGSPVEVQRTLQQEEIARRGGNGKETQESCGDGDKRLKRLLNHGKSGRILSGRWKTKETRMILTTQPGIKQGIQFQDTRDGSQGSGTWS
jgi:hypothetical protein